MLKLLINNRKIKRLIPFISLFSLLIIYYFFTKNSTSKKSLINISTNPKIKNQSNFDTKSIKFIQNETILQNYKSMIIEKNDNINWNNFAYVFYATNSNKLLSIFINIKQLRKFKTLANIEILCSFDFNSKNENILIKNLIKLLEERYLAILTFVKPINSKFTSDSSNWSNSFTKFHAFNLIKYDRVIYLDSDSIIRKRMDQLFLLPPCLLATTINYINHPFLKFPNIIKSQKDLINDDLPPTPFERSLSIQDLYKNLIESETNFDSNYFNNLYSELPTMESAFDLFSEMNLGSYLMVITPDTRVFNWLIEMVQNKSVNEYDMEIINQVWNIKDIINNNIYEIESSRDRDTENNSDDENEKDNSWLKNPFIPSLMIIPHEPYGLLSGEFRHSLFDHYGYLTEPQDFGYLTKSLPVLSFQKIIKNDIYFKTVDDLLETFPEIPYWDWKWKFDFEGKIIDYNLLDDNELNDKDNSNLKFNEKRNILPGEIIDDKFDKDINIITSGMGIDKLGWDPKNIYDNSIYIHWSDWPLGKPWEFGGINDIINIDNINDETDLFWLFNKIAQESLENCINESNDLLDKLTLKSNIKLDNRNSRLITQEKKYYEKICKQSIDTWKNIYKDYWKLLNKANEEINSV